MPPEIISDAFINQLNAKVTEYMTASGNCAQTTFLTLQEGFNLEDGAILKALTPFPGMALRGETCGTVTGSLMAIGLVYGRGRDRLGDWSLFTACLRPARRFCREFEKIYGSTRCGDVVERQFGKRFDLANPAQSMEWYNHGAMDKCAEVVRMAIRIAGEIIASKER